MVFEVAAEGILSEATELISVLTVTLIGRLHSDFLPFASTERTRIVRSYPFSMLVKRHDGVVVERETGVITVGGYSEGSFAKSSAVYVPL